MDWHGTLIGSYRCHLLAYRSLRAWCFVPVSIDRWPTATSVSGFNSKWIPILYNPNYLNPQTETFPTKLVLLRIFEYGRRSTTTAQQRNVDVWRKYILKYLSVHIMILNPLWTERYILFSESGTAGTSSTDITVLKQQTIWVIAASMMAIVMYAVTNVFQPNHRIRSEVVSAIKKAVYIIDFNALQGPYFSGAANWVWSCAGRIVLFRWFTLVDFTMEHTDTISMFKGASRLMLLKFRYVIEKADYL